MQLSIEWRSTFLAVIGFGLWLPFFYCLILAITDSSRRAKYGSLVFSIFCLLTVLLTRGRESAFVRYFGVIPAHSNVTFSWGPFISHFPHETWFFLCVGGVGFYLCKIFFRSGRWHYLLWLCILISTWIHSSLHSPYTYLPHFEREAHPPYWYHTDLFPGQLGSVNEDYYWFHQSESLFLGSLGKLEVFWGRTLPFFLSSRFTPWIHPYYVWLSINLGFWLLSVWGVYYVSRFYFGERAGRICAALQASAPGLIVYVAQPKPYALAFSLVAIVLALFLYLMVDRYTPWRSPVLFGFCFAVTLLCYEFQPWFLIFPFWARSLRISYKDISVFSVTALLLYVGWFKLPSVLTALECQATLQAGYGNPLENAWALFTSGDWGKIFATLHYSIKSTWVMTFHAFPLALPAGLFGIYLLIRKYRASKGLLWILSPGFVACLMIGIGNQPIYFKYPRVVYGAYVAMYLLMTLTLLEIQQRWGKAVLMALVLLNFIFWNIDVMGVPAVYYHWFYRFPGHANWW